MTPDPRHLRLGRIVGPFAEHLLTADLPQLPSARRDDVVRFIERRMATVPSFTRFGIMVIGLLYRVLLTVAVGRTVLRFLVARPLPLLGEYPRLVRSLGYAYIWERWPDTTPTGAPR